MNYITKLIPMTKTLAAAVALLLAGGVIYQVAAQRRAPRPNANAFAQQGNDAATAKFDSARDLIDDAQWAKAAAEFAQYISAYPQEKNLDAAMYWLAYSQYQLRQFNQSKDTIDRLLKAYDKSSWKEDAELLMAQIPGAVTVKVDPVTVSVDPVIATQVAAPIAPVTVTVEPPPGAPAPVALAIAGQDPVEAEVRTQEMQERIAEAQARAEERTREAQERVAERMAKAKEKFKDKGLKFDFDFDFDFDTGKDTGDDPCEFKIVVLQALFESDPQRGIAVATDWVKPTSGQTVTCKRAALRLLARHGGKGVTPTILGVAQNESDLKLRTTAISLLGATNDDSVIDPLRDFALNSPQMEISEAAL